MLRGTREKENIINRDNVSPTSYLIFSEMGVLFVASHDTILVGSFNSPHMRRRCVTEAPAIPKVLVLHVLRRESFVDLRAQKRHDFDCYWSRPATTRVEHPYFKKYACGKAIT